MHSLLSTAGLARASARHPWRVLGLWLLIIVLAGAAATTLGDALTTSFNFTNKPESVRGQDLLDERMGGPQPMTETVIVRSDTLTVDDPAFQDVVQKTTADLLAMQGVVAQVVNYYQAQAAQLPQAAELVSADRHSTLIPVTFAGTYDEMEEHADDYLAAVRAHGANGVEVLTIGDISLNHEFTAISETDLQKAELFGLPVALIILVVVFGALVAAGVPLVLAIVSIIVAIGLTALVGRAMDLSFYVINMITMIGLAVGIDYALFIISRYREERGRGVQKLDAIAIAGGTASKAVLFSGFTVVLALGGMLLLPTTIFRSLGAGAVLVVIVAMGAMLTLVPAMVSLLGDRIDWPRRRTYATATTSTADHWNETTLNHGFWGRVTRTVTARPVVSLVLAGTLLVAAAIPYVDLNRGFAGVETLPESDVKTAFQILERDFSAGVLEPVSIVVDAPRSPQAEAEIETLISALQQDTGFVPAAQVTWNDAGDLALVELPLSTDANSPAAYDTIDRLRGELIPSAFAGDAARVYVTGNTAFNADFFQLVDDYTPVVFAFVLGLSFVLLLLAFRSLVVPVTAILMNLLSVGAAYGLMVLVFQKGIGADLFGFQQTPMIESWVPIFLFCVLFGLSMDYHVFLLSRIREHYDATHRNRESVAVGLQATGRLITGAALIMVVVFSAFATGKLVVFQQLGFGLAVAVLLDATVVRSVLVPSGMTLLGNLNWYLPRWLHWLPDLRIEGGEAHAPAPQPQAGLLVDQPEIALDPGK